MPFGLIDRFMVCGLLNKTIPIDDNWYCFLVIDEPLSLAQKIAELF